MSIMLAMLAGAAPFLAIAGILVAVALIAERIARR